MSHQPLTLAELIRQHQDRTGDSYSQIAMRAGLSKAKIGQLAIRDQLHMPRVDTIDKIAAGLQLPRRVIQQAAMASAGIAPDDYEVEQRLDLIVSRLHGLAPTDLDYAALFIEALYSRNHHV